MNKTLMKKKKKPNDNILTPDNLVKDIMKLLKFNKNDIVLDGFKGENGVFYNNYPFCEKKWCEIKYGKDFFNYNDNVNWVISNPPFSKLNKILDHCCSICTNGFGFIMLTLALTPSRIKRMNENGFYITLYEIFNVKKWFGFTCCFVLWEKNKTSIFKLNKKQY